ncbi:MAG TPA: hypothetical protein VK835_15445 [Bacteroidia bacterium]|jgi:hypothetical protein|nr:hypothetical protein [Bacteroidia bacterium]
MKKVFLLIVFFSLLAASNKKESPIDFRVRAKHVADSILYTYVPKSTFLKFYSFDAKYSKVSFYSQAEEKTWLTMINTKPDQYTLVYSLIKQPTSCFDYDVRITLNSNYKLLEITDLIDSTYLKPFINKDKLLDIKKRINHNNNMDYLIFDSIPNKITFKPFIELNYYIRTIHSAPADEDPCIYNIDTCFKIDPYTGKTIVTYTKSNESCF